ncbi:DNA methyltransferase [Globicatella sanguinis]
MEPRKLTKADIDKVRHIEGFPVGSDEDIIALSNAPYYTACPNPFIEEFIRENGTPYDEATDDYHREPFAADVSEGKRDDIYNYHTYHTKVPPKAILKYILHYTKPGDIVYDAFCGSGMTGVAAAMAGNDTFTEYHPNTGVRYSILSDLSVAATFIAQGYNYPQNISKVSQLAEEALQWLRKDFGWAYETSHVGQGQTFINSTKGNINYTVWSDIVICPQCGQELNFYKIGIDSETGHKKGGGLTCKHCGFTGKGTEFERAVTTVFDDVTGEAIQITKEEPVLINYTYAGKKYDKEPDDEDLTLIEKVSQMKIPAWYPKDEVPDGFNTSQPKKSHLVKRIDLFYNKRSLIAFAKLWDYVENVDERYRNILKFWLQTVSVGFTKTNRYFSSSFSQVNRYLKGTLYIAATRSEVSPWYALSGKAKKITKLISNSNCIVTCMSSERSLIPNNSIDYIFIDPPFGSNIMYSDLNIIWESWLRIYTQSGNEAIINDVSNKDDAFYKEMMLKVLSDCYRVLKPNRWITIEFHNSQNKVWNILQSVISQSGFVVADVRVLDKQVQTMKQYSTKNSVDKDLVISAYKPSSSLENEMQQGSVSEETAWAFVRNHLHQLPVVVINGDKIEIVAERQAIMLWDRMVAYHLMNGVAIPMDAAEFYQGLDSKFLKRDGMYFLSDQVNEYDTARIVNDIEPIQFELFVTNEKSAISWLYQQLSDEFGGPQTYAELQPKFMQEVKSVDKFEAMPELSVLLEENFLQDEKGRWYIPDTTKEGDVAKLREKKLWKEFEGYMNSKGKLKLFRSEAIRVGFSRLWKDKNYQAIVTIAERLPEKAIQEDANLLMYYDISLSRV